MSVIAAAVGIGTAYGNRARYIFLRYFNIEIKVLIELSGYFFLVNGFGNVLVGGVSVMLS